MSNEFYGDIVDDVSEEFNVNGSPKLNNTIRYLVDKMKVVDPETIQTELENRPTISETRLKAEKLSQTDMTEEFLQQITGATPINAVPADYSLTPKKMAFNVVEGVASKNLFNKNDITAGYYVGYTTGLLVADPNENVSGFIPIKPNTSYIISNSTEQIAFFDSNKNFISGIGMPNAAFTSPANAYYIRVSLLTYQLDTYQLEEGTVKTSYESYGAKVNHGLIKPKSVKNEHLEDATITDTKLAFLPVQGYKSKNLYDKSKITQGYYVGYTTGLLVSNANETVSDYIPVQPSTSYRISGTNEQLAFFDVNKAFISGLDFASKLTTIPANAAYIRMSALKTQVDKVQLEQSSSITSYMPYGTRLSTQAIDGLETVVKTTTLKVKKDGSGDFTNPVAATNSIDVATLSSTNRYVIEIYDDHDIMTYFSQAYLDAAQNTLNKRGWEVPDFVDLVGIGKQWHLKGELGDTATNTQIESLSTINLSGTNRIENLKVTARNLRYAVHDETSNGKQNWTKRVKNCHFEHYGNKPGSWQSNSAWGEGSSSGSDSEFDNCIFVSNGLGVPYSTHNNANYDKPVKLKHINSRFIHKENNTAFRLGSMGSNQKCPVILIGCEFTGKMLVKEEVTNSGVGIDYVLSGYGNSFPLYQFTNTDGKKYNYDFAGETINQMNISGATILKGTPVKQSNVGSIAPMVTADGSHLFYGVSFADIDHNAYGLIKTAGYVLLTDIGLTANVGDKIGIVNGAFAVVTSGDYIGTVTISGYMKLK